MTNFLSPDAVKELGFPIAVAVFMLTFFFWTFCWLTKTNDKQYSDHRKDIKDLSDSFNSTINKTVSAFELSVKGTEERQTQIIGHLADLKKNTDLILDKVSKKK